MRHCSDSCLRQPPPSRTFSPPPSFPCAIWGLVSASSCSAGGCPDVATIPPSQLRAAPLLALLSSSFISHHYRGSRVCRSHGGSHLVSAKQRLFRAQTKFNMLEPHSTTNAPGEKQRKGMTGRRDRGDWKLCQNCTCIRNVTPQTPSWKLTASLFKAKGN